MTSSTRSLKLVAMILSIAAVAASCGGDSLADEPIAGIVRTPAPQVADLNLPRSDGQGAYPLAASEGEILVLYFGYTGCPDVCPTTLADLHVALNGLEDDASKIDVAMATVDPDRDTDEIMSAYVTSFVSNAVGLRTEDDDQLQTIAERFGINYSVDVDDTGLVEVSHTGFLYAIDREGNLLVTWAFGTPATEMERDLSILLDRLEA